MNDIELIRDLRPDVPLPAMTELAPARDRLMRAVAADIAPGGGNSLARPGPARRPASRSASRRNRPRLALPGAVAAVALASGVTAVIVSSASAPSRHPAPSVSAHPGRVRLPATLSAAQWLTSAASAARRQSAVVPRPDQYVYAETAGPHGRSRYQIWQSADGSRAGLVEPVTGGQVVLPSYTVAQAEGGAGRRCSLAAGYLPQMPVRPRALFAFLVRIGYATASVNHKPIPNWAANDLGGSAVALLTQHYLTPGQRAGLFDLMARTPGFRLVRHAVDTIGRRGVAISWTYEGATSMIIFDRVTYACLGDSVTYPGSRPASGPGDCAAALVMLKVVDTIPAPVPTGTPTPASAG